MPLTTIYGDGTRVIGSDTQPLFSQPLHPDVSGYVARLTAAGYMPSTIEINAVNNLVYKFIGCGFYSKMQVIYPVIGNSGTTSTLDLKNLCNGTANGSWTFDANGMKPTSISGNNYINTNYNPSVRATQNDAHFSVYTRDTNTTAARRIMGNQDATASFFFTMSAATGIQGDAIIFAQTAQRPIATGVTDAKGFWVGQRTASTSQFLYYNGLQVGSGAGASVALTNFNRNTYLGGSNNGGATAQSPSDQNIAFASFGLSMTATQIANMYAAVQAYQTELGRQV